MLEDQERRLVAAGFREMMAQENSVNSTATMVVCVVTFAPARKEDVVAGLGISRVLLLVEVL